MQVLLPSLPATGAAALGNCAAALGVLGVLGAQARALCCRRRGPP
jgi:hypothetical protein